MFQTTDPGVRRWLRHTPHEVVNPAALARQVRRAESELAQLDAELRREGYRKTARSARRIARGAA